MTIHDMTAVDLLAAYKSKKLSPVDVVDAVIERIETWEPKLKALYAPDFGGARTAAQASEKRWQAGQPQGALDGVPITIKENIATRGVPVPLGTAASDMTPAAADAPAAARVREAGAIVLAKTKVFKNMHRIGAELYASADLVQLRRLLVITRLHETRRLLAHQCLRQQLESFRP